MINFFILIFFFIYSFIVFFIDNIFLLTFIFIFNIIISLILKVSIKKHLILLKNNLLFILFIIIFNLPFNNICYSTLIGIRLFLVIDYTYVIGNYFNTTKIRIAFKYLLTPLKIFKVNIDDLTLIISIALAFIPILSDEVKTIILSLKSKGFDLNIKNVITKPYIFLITFINSLFDRLDELERCLISKGF